MFYVYILLSKTKGLYYVGFTSMILEERLRRHLSDHKGFTARAKDWEIVYQELFTNKSVAILREKEIKKWKSKIKIEALFSK